MEWAVENLIPRRHLSTIYGPAGVGKTSFISALAVQLTRPHGGQFLGEAVTPGRVVIIDADDQTGYGYQAWLNRFAAGVPDADLSRVDVKGLHKSLNPKTLDALETNLRADPPALMVVDTFASAFHDVDVLKGHRVQDQLLRLAAMANNLNCAVVTLDHVAKLQRGETVAGRGPYGAAKTFTPRAIFA